MKSATTVSFIGIEPEADNPNNSNEKDKFAQRFKPSSLKPNKQSNNQKQTPSSSSSSNNEQPLRADDIKDYRIWAIVASIIFCFIIAPFFALYHSRRIRKMKNNEELNRAQQLSGRVSNILVISSIIGIVVWVAILFVIAVLFIMGHWL